MKGADPRLIMIAANRRNSVHAENYDLELIACLKPDHGTFSDPTTCKYDGFERRQPGHFYLVPALFDRKRRVKAHMTPRPHILEANSQIRAEALPVFLSDERFRLRESRAVLGYSLDLQCPARAPQVHLKLVQRKELTEIHAENENSKLRARKVHGLISCVPKDFSEWW